MSVASSGRVAGRIDDSPVTREDVQLRGKRNTASPGATKSPTIASKSDKVAWALHMILRWPGP